MGRHGHPIIQGIDLEIAPGTFVGIIGESGAGKSTLLRALSIHLGKKGDHGDLLLGHSEGWSLVEGETHDAYLDRLGFVPQEDHFIEGLTAEETLIDACTFAGVSASETAKRSRALFRSVGLPEEIRGNPIGTLSGGQKRRLSIARALASAPEILMLDEPTSGLDLPVAQEIMDMLANLCRGDGITIVCTSHLPSTLKVCDRVLLMSAKGSSEGGTVIADHDAASFRAALDSDETGAAVYVRRTELSQSRSIRADSLPLVPMPEPDADHRKLGHFQAIFCRSWNSWRRDWSNVFVFVGQPVILALIIILTQSLHRVYAGEFIDFFLTVAALWIGMSLCIRDFVSERELYALDELTGLSNMAFFWAKICYASALAVVGVLVLCVVAHLGVWGADKCFDLQYAREDFTIWHFMWRFVILAITGISGALIGLILSLVASTERAAISLMPLALLPQDVFSRFACGFASKPASKLDPEKTFPFHSLTHWNDREYSPDLSSIVLDWINFIATLPMTTRHASWSLESLTDSLTTEGFEFSRFHWVDFAFLVVLVMIQIFVVYVVFRLKANNCLLRIR